MFIEAIGKPRFYPVPIVDGKTPDFELFSFRSYMTLGGKIKEVSKYIMEGKRKIKSIHHKERRFKSIEVLPNQIKMEFKK